jgi:transcriptional regulator with XRE-family HTH domain
VPSSKEIRDAIGKVEMATTDSWRQQMRAARLAQKIKQHEIARMLSVKQGTVSQIESGKIRASIYVPAIALILGLDLPQFEVLDSEDAEWIKMGRELRKQSLAMFRRAKAIVRTLGSGDPDS